MQSVELTHTVEASPDAVRGAITDLDQFMRAAGFDEVTVDGDRLDLSKALGLFKVSLSLRIVDDPDAVLACEQIDGIFEHLRTTYTLTERGGHTEVTARTEFGLDAPGGSILDATLIERQRRKEIEAQFEYLDAEATS